MTSNPQTYTQLALLWGVEPMLVTETRNADEKLDRGVRQSCTKQILEDGDMLVIIAVTSQPVGVVTRSSNVLRIAYVRQRGL